MGDKKAGHVPAAIPDGIREWGADRPVGRVEVRSGIDERSRHMPIVAAGSPVEGRLRPGVADVGIGAGVDKQFYDLPPLGKYPGQSATT